MIYKFKSKAAGDVIMMGPRGDEVLRVIGIEPAAAGVIEPAALPAALCAIEQAIARQDAQGPHADARADVEERTASNNSSWVTLRQRTWPLVEMMKRAHRENDRIVWGGV